MSETTPIVETADEDSSAGSPMDTIEEETVTSSVVETVTSSAAEESAAETATNSVAAESPVENATNSAAETPPREEEEVIVEEEDGGFVEEVIEDDEDDYYEEEIIEEEIQEQSVHSTEEIVVTDDGESFQGEVEGPGGTRNLKYEYASSDDDDIPFMDSDDEREVAMKQQEQAAAEKSEEEDKNGAPLDKARPLPVSPMTPGLVEEDRRVSEHTENTENSGTRDPSGRNVFQTGENKETGGTKTDLFGSSEPANDAVVGSTTVASDIENQNQVPSGPPPPRKAVIPRPPPPKRRSAAWYWVGCILVLGLLGAGGYVGYWLAEENKGGDAPKIDDPEDNSTPSPTQAPTIGATTEFDAIQGNCDFMGLENPHPVDQCSCLDEIQIIPNDVRNRYDMHLQYFIPTLYMTYDEDISSCSARNQALVWLSSGNDSSFTSDERTERYALATIFAALGGNKWEDRSNWLSTLGSCSWFGVNCAEGKATNLNLAGNNAVDTVSSS